MIRADVLVMFASRTSRLYVSSVCASVDELMGTVGFVVDGAADGARAAGVGAAVGDSAAAKETVSVICTAVLLAAKPAQIVTVLPSVGITTENEVVVPSLTRRLLLHDPDEVNMAWFDSKTYWLPVVDSDTCSVSPATYVLEPEVSVVPDLLRTTFRAVDAVDAEIMMVVPTVKDLSQVNLEA